jgi:hypothetical protein
MALAVLFLLTGMLAAELALVGIDAAGLAGAVLLAIAAALLVHDRARSTRTEWVAPDP